MSQPQPRANTLDAWAAYVAGHHLAMTQDTLGSIWHYRDHPGVRDDVNGERLRGVIETFNELLEAVDELFGFLPLTPRRHGQLGRWVQSWADQTSSVLRQIGQGFEDDDSVDWENAAPPNWRRFGDVFSTISEGLQEHPHYLRWFRLGEDLASESVMRRLPDEVRLKTRDALRQLQAEGGYPFVGDLVKILSRRVGKKPRGPGTELIDPTVGKPTTGRLAEYIKQQLQKGVSPTPCVIVEEECIHFFGQIFTEAKLDASQWRILRLLCTHPFDRLPRRKIRTECELHCTNLDLPPHISRLRGRLKPAIRAWYRGKELPEHADKAFILSYKEGEGPYQLHLDPALVKRPRDPEV